MNEAPSRYCGNGWLWLVCFHGLFELYCFTKLIVPQILMFLFLTFCDGITSWVDYIYLPTATIHFRPFRSNSRSTCLTTWIFMNFQLVLLATNPSNNGSSWYISSAVPKPGKHPPKTQSPSAFVSCEWMPCYPFLGDSQMGGQTFRYSPLRPLECGKFLKASGISDILTKYPNRIGELNSS